MVNLLTRMQVGTIRVLRSMFSDAMASGLEQTKFCSCMLGAGARPPARGVVDWLGPGLSGRRTIYL